MASRRTVFALLVLAQTTCCYGFCPSLACLPSRRGGGFGPGAQAGNVRGASLRPKSGCSISNAHAQLDMGAATNDAMQGQANTINMLINELGMQPEDAPFSLGLRGGLQGTVQSWSGGDVSWCSTLDLVDSGFSQSMLTMWNSPLVGVPHFRSSLTLAPDSVRLFVDFCPRGDAGYEQVLPDGTYAEPDSRDKFVQRSLRTEFEELYFASEARAWLQRAVSADGAQVSQAPPQPLCDGPLRLDLLLPPTPASVAHATTVRTEAAQLYVGWMGAAERFGQVKSQLAFAHDCKVRAIISGGQSALLEQQFGPEAGELAAAHGGPRDIVDRGGAMSNAAKDNLTPGEAGNA